MGLLWLRRLRGCPLITGLVVLSPTVPVHMSTVVGRDTEPQTAPVRPAPWMVGCCHQCVSVCGEWVNERQIVKLNATIFFLRYLVPSTTLASTILDLALPGMQLDAHTFQTPNFQFVTQDFCYKFVVSKPKLR